MIENKDITLSDGTVVTACVMTDDDTNEVRITANGLPPGVWIQELVDKSYMVYPTEDIVTFSSLEEAIDSIYIRS